MNPNAGSNMVVKYCFYEPIGFKICNWILSMYRIMKHLIIHNGRSKITEVMIFIFHNFLSCQSNLNIFIPYNSYVCFPFWMGLPLPLCSLGTIGVCLWTIFRPLFFYGLSDLHLSSLINEDLFDSYFTSYGFYHGPHFYDI